MPLFVFATGSRLMLVIIHKQNTESFKGQVFNTVLSTLYKMIYIYITIHLSIIYSAFLTQKSPYFSVLIIILK